MRFLIFLTVAALAAMADNPTARDAYVFKEGKVVQGMRLTDTVSLVFCQPEYDAWRKAHQDTKVLLYLDGHAMKETFASEIFAIPTDIVTNNASRCGGGPLIALQFYLDPNLVAKAETKAAWLQLLQRPWEKDRVAITAGSDTEMWPGTTTIAFIRFHVVWFWLWAALFVIALAVFIKYAIHNDIIRDAGTLPATAPAGSRKAFSLGRTQMAVWTFVIAPALAFIFMVTWNASAISNGVLVLMGLSFGTTLMASVADGPGDPQVSKGFFEDLVTDGTGPSMHRYQMVLFTVILVIIFITKTAVGLVMPDFDPSLLALMGISNGTYLGFKLQGK